MCSGESIGDLAGHIGMKFFLKKEEFHINKSEVLKTSPSAAFSIKRSFYMLGK